MRSTNELRSVEVGAPTHQHLFAGWLDTDRLVVSSRPGCGGVGEPDTVAIMQVQTGEVTPILSIEASLDAMVWNR